jgi:tetratricopeptide (TPR) repeat protein
VLRNVVTIQHPVILKVFPARSHESLSCRVRLYPLIAFLCFTCLPSGSAAGQGAPNILVLTPEVRSHWQAAQNAQGRKDYDAAAREYREVIAKTPGFAEAYQNLGLAYQLEERWPDAMQAFLKALALEPALAGANLFLGVDYCQQGEGRRAIPYLARAARERPELLEAWAWLATAQEMQGDITTEITTLKRGLQARPEDVDLLYLLGQAYETLGKQAVDSASALDSSSADREQFLAETYESNGYWSEALVHLQNALARSPSRKGVHLDIGEVLMRTGRLDSALDEIDAELKLYPHSLRARVRRGEIELLQGEVQPALTEWSEAIKVDLARTEAVLGIVETGFGETSKEQLSPRLRQNLSALDPALEAESGIAARLAIAFIASQDGDASTADPELGAAGTEPAQEGNCSVGTVQTWLREDRLEEVARCATRVVTAQSPLPLRVSVAEALLETSRPEPALAILSAPPAAQSHAPELLYWKSRCYKKLALAAYLKLYAAAPDSCRAHELNADTYAARDEDEKAIGEYRLALAQRPHLPNLHYEIGRLLWKGYKTDDARVEFEAELKMNPRHVGALTSIGTVYLYEHEPEGAIGFLQRAAALAPDNIDVHQYLGTAYLQMRRYAEAVKELKIGIRQDDEGKIHYQLAKAYQALGRKDEATAEFAASNVLNERFHSRSSERVQRLAAAEAALRQP